MMKEMKEMKEKKETKQLTSEKYFMLGGKYDMICRDILAKSKECYELEKSMKNGLINLEVK